MVNFGIVSSILFLYLASGILAEGRLVWSDEFNDGEGTTPSLDKWRYDLGDGTSAGVPGWGNGELQYYTNISENIATDGKGHLVIKALRPNVTYDCFYGRCTYTSARLVSKSTQMYGLIEARIKSPSGKGLWPAFWMLGDNIESVGWPQCGTINIMDLRGSDPNKIISALHGPGYIGKEAVSSIYTLKSGNGSPSFSDDFHVFALRWEPDRVTWLVDGEAYITRTPADLPKGRQWVFDHPFRILINLAVGGSFDGFPKSDEIFPKSLVVDYVRVYDFEDNQSNVVASEMVKDRVGTPNEGIRHKNFLFNVIVVIIMCIVISRI